MCKLMALFVLIFTYFVTCSTSEASTPEQQCTDRFMDLDLVTYRANILDTSKVTTKLDNKVWILEEYRFNCSSTNITSVLLGAELTLSGSEFPTLHKWEPSGDKYYVIPSSERVIYFSTSNTSTSGVFEYPLNPPITISSNELIAITQPSNDGSKMKVYYIEGISFRTYEESPGADNAGLDNDPAYTDRLILVYPVTDGNCINSQISAATIRENALKVHESGEMNGERQYIYPEMKFSCNGSIVKWIYSGKHASGSNFPELQIWRKTAGGTSAYTRIATSIIDTNTPNGTNLYEFVPPTPLEFQEGDIFGVYVPDNAQLKLYNQDNSGPINHVTSANSPLSTITGGLSTRGNDFPLVTAVISILATVTSSIGLDVTNSITISDTTSIVQQPSSSTVTSNDLPTSTAQPSSSTVTSDDLLTSTAQPSSSTVTSNDLPTSTAQPSSSTVTSDDLPTSTAQPSSSTVTSDDLPSSTAQPSSSTVTSDDLPTSTAQPSSSTVTSDDLPSSTAQPSSSTVTSDDLPSSTAQPSSSTVTSDDLPSSTAQPSSSTVTSDDLPSSTAQPSSSTVTSDDLPSSTAQPSSSTVTSDDLPSSTAQPSSSTVTSNDLLQPSYTVTSDDLLTKASTIQQSLFSSSESFTSSPSPHQPVINNDSTLPILLPVLAIVLIISVIIFVIIIALIVIIHKRNKKRINGPVSRTKDQFFNPIYGQSSEPNPGLDNPLYTGNDREILLQQSLYAEPSINSNVGKLHYEGVYEMFPNSESKTTDSDDANFYNKLDRNVQSMSVASSITDEQPIYWEPETSADKIYQQLSDRKFREILRDKIQITKYLGSGEFGTVNQGVWNATLGLVDVAIKTLNDDTSEDEKVKFLQEAAIMGQFHHPNIVKLHGVVTVGEPIMIVLEFMTQGDLREYLINMKSGGKMDISTLPSHLLSFGVQIASGANYLSNKCFVHRDLAARNILVTDNGICKIGDFGMSRDLQDEDYYISHAKKIPVKWTAPEALHFKRYTTASDVWSYGAVLYEIWSLGHKPYESYTNQQCVRLVDSGYRLPPPPGCPRGIYEIMIQCWNPTPSNRPTFAKIVSDLTEAKTEATSDAESSHCPTVLGGPIETAHNLYIDLQKFYMT